MGWSAGRVQVGTRPREGQGMKGKATPAGGRQRGGGRRRDGAGRQGDRGLATPAPGSRAERAEGGASARARGAQGPRGPRPGRGRGREPGPGRPQGDGWGPGADRGRGSPWQNEEGAGAGRGRRRPRPPTLPGPETVSGGRAGGSGARLALRRRPRGTRGLSPRLPRPGRASPRPRRRPAAGAPPSPTFSPGPGAAGAGGTSRAPPWPASWSHAPGARRSGPRAADGRETRRRRNWRPRGWRSERDRPEPPVSRQPPGQGDGSAEGLSRGRERRRAPPAPSRGPAGARYWLALVERRLCRVRCRAVGIERDLRRGAREGGPAAPHTLRRPLGPRRRQARCMPGRPRERWARRVL